MGSLRGCSEVLYGAKLCFSIPSMRVLIGFPFSLTPVFPTPVGDLLLLQSLSPLSSLAEVAKGLRSY